MKLFKFNRLERMQRLLIGVLLFFCTLNILPQNSDNVINYERPREYEIADIQVTGVEYVDPGLLANMSGLKVGSTITIPGDEISKVIQKFWSQQLFSDVKVVATKTEKGKVWLEIRVKERPRISKLTINGIKKSEKQELTEQLKIRSGSQLTPNLLNNIEHVITKHFDEKGFLNADIEFIQQQDTTYANRVNLTINVDKNDKVKIQDIVFRGNEVYHDRRLRRVLKNTKKRNLNIFKSAKFIRSDYKEDKEKLYDFYNKNGYRDFKILDDTIIDLNEKRIKLVIDVEEGSKYYFGDIEWVGNTVYTASRLNRVLGIQNGDVYNQELLDERLTVDDDAVTALYMDNGYLFFSVNPVEVDIEADTIDFEMQLYEGQQATIDEIIIKGNTTTNEHVIRRELRTHPGDLFSRSKLIRSVRELASLGHFDPENITPNPIPNPSDGTVDIEYNLEERSNDQLEISAGYGGYGAVGTIGLKFSNFSTRRMFDKEAWSPLPRGDGQTLSLRAQLNGAGYQSYNMSFVEPWFGGKKPNSFSFSVFYNIVDYGAQSRAVSRQNPTYRQLYSRRSESSFKAIGSSVGLGRRLTWPDDFFSHYHELSFQRYDLNNYNISTISNGQVHNLNINNRLSRNSMDQKIYPRRGSNFSLSLQLTPPYSLFKEDNYWELSDEERRFYTVTKPTNLEGEALSEYNPDAEIARIENARRHKWLEYHKWKFKGEWYMSLIGNLVISPRIEYGHLAMYNRNVGHSPFEKFAVGGDGLSGYNMTGTDVVALRGYPNRTITPMENGRENGNIYTKYTLELRYPFTLNPSATVFGLVFLEAGNAWSEFSEFDPFVVKRSAGVGVRAFLPMFGMLGIDWGYGFDKFVNNGREYGGQGEFHFILGQQF